MISSRASIGSCRIGDGVSIGDFAVVHDGVEIGAGAVIHPHAVLYPCVILGEGTEVFPGAVIGKEPKGAGATARLPTFERSVRIGSGCSVGPHAVVFYDVVVGDGTLLGDGASIREQCRVGSRCIISRYVTLNYNVTVGDRVKIMDMTHITGNTLVEDDVFVSTHVATTNDNQLGRDGYAEGQIRGPTLRRGARVGAGAVLLPGVEIGAGALVGAGAVVTRDVAPRSLVMGAPARHVRDVG